MSRDRTGCAFGRHARLAAPGIALLLLLGQTACGIAFARPNPTPTATATATATSTPTPTPTSTATATATPTATPTATATPTPTLTPTNTPPPDAVLLSPMSHEYQDWNNCAPISAAMVLSYYGIQKGQYEVAAALRPHKDDKHVEADEVIAYLRGYGLEAGLYVNGTPERLEALVGAGVPVLIQTWLNDRPTGHYRVIRGYDRSAGVFILNDSYYGPKVSLTVAALERVWAPFNHRYIPVYPPQRAAEICRILGEDCHSESMYRRAAAAAREWIERSPNDPYAWFSLGDDLLALGDAAGALEAYGRAAQIGLPEHMLWYRFGPFEAHLALGQYDEVLSLSKPVLEELPAIEELHIFRARAYEGLGQPDMAREEYRLAFLYHPGYPPAVEGLERLGAELPPTPTITPTRTPRPSSG
ncbi:MAG: C39 family peptidase [Anaerolineae bacterium]|nr:C39 family peptidase [Anaerolineae bacterium]